MMEGTNPNIAENAAAKGNGASIDQAFRDALVREIAAENALVTNRMSWNLTFQGFLFAGFGVALGDRALSSLTSVFLAVLPVAGLVTAISAYVGMRAAFAQIDVLKGIWHDRPQLGLWGPQPFSDPRGDYAGRIPAHSMVAVLVAGWVVLGLTAWFL